MIEVGDRVKVVRMRQFKKELVEDFNDQPIEVVEISEAWAGSTRYKIEMHNVLNVQGTNVVKWVDESDIVLDIEYYRNEKLNKILEK
jgi:acetoacetate decarboxylase